MKNTGLSGRTRGQRKVLMVQTRKGSKVCATGNGGGNLRVGICGGGIQGLATAHYLQEKYGITATIIERHKVAGAASGKAGGFLAQDWNDGGPVGELARLSYGLHKELADQFGRDAIGYRELDTLSMQIMPGAPNKKKGAPAWIDGGLLASKAIGDTSTTAQVHPYKLCQAFLDSSKARVVHGKVVGIRVEGGGVKVAVEPAEGGQSSEDEFDRVLVAMGPWSGAAMKWLGTPYVTGVAAHSVLLKPEKEVTPHALFTNIMVGGGAKQPEVYPRPDGMVYVCGESYQEDPAPPDSITPDEGRCNTLVTLSGYIGESLKSAKVEERQVCHLPAWEGSAPIISPVPGHEGVFMATGHTCWGILNGPATGAVMSDLLVNGNTDLVDMKPFLLQGLPVPA